ncbi:hypothetical protein F4680DRAFT_226099 [Xylaria scruposa]|nr:hypothetical protein F4680DRAFT_226099 [Xylaria scruposa]
MTRGDLIIIGARDRSSVQKHHTLLTYSIIAPNPYALFTHLHPRSIPPSSSTSASTGQEMLRTRYFSLPLIPCCGTSSPQMPASYRLYQGLPILLPSPSKPIRPCGNSTDQLLYIPQFYLSYIKPSYPLKVSRKNPPPSWLQPGPTNLGGNRDLLDYKSPPAVQWMVQVQLVNTPSQRPGILSTVLGCDVVSSLTVTGYAQV